MALTASPTTSVRGLHGAVATADQLATQAGIRMLANGGNAVDAAIAANAAIAVTGPHMCGMGGDLFALVHTGSRVVALNATGRAGSGASADGLRQAGHRSMPFRHDVSAVTVPGCVDGWAALHARFGSMPLDEILRPAIELAGGGFPASPMLVHSLGLLDERGRAQLAVLASQLPRTGSVMRLPGARRALQAIAEHGRAGFYEGAFGEGLLELGGGWFDPADLARSQADWVDPLTTEAFGVELHTIPPNSQGYLTLAASRLATAAGLPGDPDDPRWAHLLVECATAAGYDRPDVLHDRADGPALLARIDARSGLVDHEVAGRRHVPGAAGDTTYLCTTDGHGMAVSLIQSNAAGFGSWLAEPNTGINLHNRGLGFSLERGHPAELAPGRRPPHTLSPALATRDGALLAVFGTMGGDAQPQILLQLAARMFHHGESPDRAIRAGRWVLKAPVTGFDTWTAAGGPTLIVEGHAPETWAGDLAARGHRVERTGAWASDFGHAHAIVVEPSGVLAGAADPRSVVGTCAAL